MLAYTRKAKSEWKKVKNSPEDFPVKAEFIEVEHMDTQKWIVNNFVLDAVCKIFLQ